MRIRIHTTVLLCCLLGFFQQAKGQDYIYNTYEITRTEGLLSNRVSAVYQDADGFMWFRSLDGVGRYDGHDFKWFTKSNTALRGVPRENLLVEDAEGYFWFTDGTHVDLMNRKTFEVISLEKKFPEGVPFELPIEQIWQGENGSIYFKQLTNETFYRYHPDEGFKYLPYLDGSGSVVAKPEGIWVHSKDDLWRKFDPQTGRLLKSVHMVNRGTWIKGFRGEEDWFGCLDEANQDILLIRAYEDSVEEMARFHTPTATIRERQYVLYNSVTGQLVLNVPGDQDGFTLLDLENQSLIPVRRAATKGIATYQPTILIDNRGVYWQRTPKGLRLVKVSEPIFTEYSPGMPARGLWADSQNLVIQTRFVPLAQPNQVKPIKGIKRLLSVWSDWEGRLFLGGGDGIYEISPKDFSVISLIPSRGGRTMWSIFRDRENRWWAGLLQNGLYTYESGDEYLTPYTQLNGYAQLATSTVLQLIEEGEYLWAVSNSGIYLIHKQRGVLARYSSTSDSDHRLPFDDIHFLHRDAEGVFWAATNADGLVRFELDDTFTVTTVKQYTTEDNLSSNVLYAIIEDHRERLWISTLTGISCFDKQTGEVQLFTEEDGLAQLEFNRISYFQAPDDRIYFGTISNVVAFYPDMVGDFEAYNAPIYVSDLSIFDGDSVKTFDLSTHRLSEITLKPSDRFLRINLSLVDYFHSDRLTYSYKIEGLFEDYQPIRGNVIELSGLPYGEYTLRVKGQSIDKRYTPQELTIPLIALKPIYFQTWFILLAFLMAASIATLVYIWRIQQLDQRRKELEILVEKRTAKIEEQTKQLRALDEVKSRFFANISHELRTPLSLILAPLEQLYKEKSLSNPGATYLSLIEKNARTLLKRINELLDLSRMDANQLEIDQEPTKLYPFFKTLLASYESAIQLKGIQLRFSFQLEEHTQILLDRDKVEKILSNFISNALKFTPAGGTISCIVSRRADQLEIKVADTGIGIPTDELPKIFERFYQSPHTPQHEGTGIGLALCRELAEVLGGKVWAESILKGPNETGNSGSTFYLQLPLIETFSPHARVQEAGDAPSQSISSTDELSSIAQLRPTLLMVEDNPDLQQYVNMILGESYQIKMAENGQVAWELLQNGPPPQLILSDIMMPIMDGIELLKRVKGEAQFRHIPMIMLTAQQRDEVKLEALRIGVDDYLTKPFRSAELRARVDNLLRNRSMRAEAHTEEATDNQPLTTPLGAADLEWLQTLEQIIRDNITTKGYKLSDAASEMNLSYRRLQQKLKALTGLSPKQYQRSIRLARARLVLKNGTAQTVQEAMHEIGFDNYTHFSRLYQEEFGLKPIEEIR